MRVIAIASAKGGVGKTTIAANLGVAFVQFGKKTLLIDGNITSPNLCFYFGLNYPKYSLLDFETKNDLRKITYVHKSGVHLIPAPIEVSRVNPVIIEKVIKAAVPYYDIILVDSAPNLGAEALYVLKSVKEFAIVSVPEIPSLVSGIKTAELGKMLKKRVLGMILNQATNKIHEVKEEDIRALYPIRILATLPSTEENKKALALQKPLVYEKPNHPFSIEIKKAAAKILGIKWEPPGILYKIKKFFAKRPKKEKQRSKEDLKELFDVEKIRKEIYEELRRVKKGAYG